MLNNKVIEEDKGFMYKQFWIEKSLLKHSVRKQIWVFFMNSFNPTIDEKLIGLLIYSLFKNQEGLDAFYIADYFGLNRFEGEDLDQEVLDFDGPLKNWLRLGGKVNFSWIENNGNLDHLLLGQFNFDKLRIQDPTLHKEIKVIRDKSNKRWSNDWRQIQPKILAARSLLHMKPSPDSLALTWQSILGSCARRLQQCNKQIESTKVRELSFENVANSLNSRQVIN
jgi:hypothetical protein